MNHQGTKTSRELCRQIGRPFAPLWLGGGILLLLVLASTTAAGEKERLLFRARSADAYPARDAHEGLIVAAEPFDTREKTRPVFGKADWGKAGILPVLLVMTNNTERAVRLDHLSIQLLTRDRQKIEPTPAGTVVLRLKGKESYPRDPVPSPVPRLPRRSRGGESLEVQIHEFNMRLLPPNSTASGFFYFDLGRGRDRAPGSQVYLTQLYWAHNAQPLMYFEINLDDALGAGPRGGSSPGKP